MADPSSSSSSSEGSSSSSGSPDISLRILPHIDRHLALPVVQFLEEQDVYPKQELLQAKYDLLRPTNMVHYVEEVRKDLEAAGGSAKSEGADVDKRAEQIMARRDELREKADKVIQIISAPQVAESLGQDKERNLATLKEKYSLDVDQINDLYTYGQYAYSIGDYAAASDYLSSFRILSTDPTLTLSAYWGKLVSNILEEPLEGEEKTYDAALDELKLLRDDIESHRHSRPPAAQLQQRTAWLHWSLFVYFKHPKGMHALVDAWTESVVEGGEKRRAYYLDTIQSACPWLLRYLVAAAVIAHQGPIKTASFAQSQPFGQTRRAMLSPKLFQVLRVVEAEKHQYADPITEFFRLLIGQVDFEGATQCLKAANDRILKLDYFTSSVKDEFVDRARHFMSEVYCRIHHKIDIADLSSRLGLTADEGERWIVELVRDARLDAKIDLQQNVVTMNKPAPLIHQTISDRSKQLLERAQYVLPAPVSAGGSGTGAYQDGQQGQDRRGNKGKRENASQGVGHGQTPRPVEIKS